MSSQMKRFELFGDHVGAEPAGSLAGYPAAITPNHNEVVAAEVRTTSTLST